MVVLAHVVGTAPWNLHVFAVPRIKSYASCSYDMKLMLHDVRVGGGVGLLTFFALAHMWHATQQAEVHSWCESFVEQTGETQTRWKTWPNWLPGADSQKKKTGQKRVHWNLMMVPNRTTNWRPQSLANTVEKATSILLNRSKTLQGVAISQMLRFANYQNQRDRSPVVTLF